MLNFECIGYDIRERRIIELSEAYYEGIYYPSMRDTFTVDSILCDRPKGIEDVGMDPLYVRGRRNNEGLYFYYSDVETVYSALSDKEKQIFEIFCFFMDTSRCTDEDDYDYLRKRHKAVTPNSGFKMIGYDVVEVDSFSWISGLANCCIGKDEKRPNLEIDVFNRNGLLNDLSSAIILRDWLDENVEEHSPFEIWQILMRM